MEASKTAGKELHSDDPDARRGAAAMMGAARTDRKVQSSRENIKIATEARRGKPMTEEHKAKIAEAARERWAKKHAESPNVAVTEKKKIGRPRKPEAEPEGEKRGRGRPKKSDGQTVAETSVAAVRGAEGAGQV